MMAAEGLPQFLMDCICWLAARHRGRRVLGCQVAQGWVSALTDRPPRWGQVVAEIAGVMQRGIIAQIPC